MVVADDLDIYGGWVNIMGVVEEQDVEEDSLYALGLTISSYYSPMGRKLIITLF